MKKDIRAYGYEELQKEMATIGEKAFRAKQIYETVFQDRRYEQVPVPSL